MNWKLISSLSAVFLQIFNLGAETIPRSRYAGKFDPSPVKMPRLYAARPGEMRGVWVATVRNIDFPMHKNTADFKKYVKMMFQNLKATGFNTVFFQVRPQNDAFYPSRLNPYSRYLAGKEGRIWADGRDFDPLKFVIDEAHRQGLELHAWLNPYRVAAGIRQSKSAYLKSLSPHNFARKNPHLVLETVDNGLRKLVLDPGAPQVRDFIAATVRELLNNYELDGIHFDDYFYPDHAPARADVRTFQSCNPRKLPLDEWRRNNVSILIANIQRLVKNHNRQLSRRSANPRLVSFGISPFGIWQNRKSSPQGSLTAGMESYSSHYADTRMWVKHRLVDYIAPQLYWHFDHDVAAYACLVDWWCETVRGSGVKLYIGHAAYQMGSKAWNINELYYQLRYNRARPEVAGSIIFSFRNLNKPDNPTMKQGVRNMLKKFWR